MSKKDKMKKFSVNKALDSMMDMNVSYPDMLTNDHVVYTKFKPIGFDHSIQTLMTELLHKLVMQYSDLTMSEMGYMHQISVLFSDGGIRIRMYFHPDLATQTFMTANGRTYQKPIPQIGIMNGYFFVIPGDQIDLSQVTGIEKIMAPKTKIKFNARGNKHLIIKDDASMKLQEALYVECNLPITIAAIMDIDITDPDFSVSASTVSQADNKRAILVDGRSNSYQIWVNVKFGERATETGYNPNDAYAYLVQLASQIQDAKSVQKKLMSQASEATEKKTKNEYKRYSRYL